MGVRDCSLFHKYVKLTHFSLNLRIFLNSNWPCPTNEATPLSPADLMDFNAKDAIENQIYFHLSIQIESAEESTAKQQEGPH